jgi:hypothetical protein
LYQEKILLLRENLKVMEENKEDMRYEKNLIATSQV